MARLAPPERRAAAGMYRAVIEVHVAALARYAAAGGGMPPSVLGERLELLRAGASVWVPAHFFLVKQPATSPAHVVANSRCGSRSGRRRCSHG